MEGAHSVLKTSWKRFEEWVTELRLSGDLFSNVLWRLTLSYVIANVVILLVLNGLLWYLRRHVLTNNVLPHFANDAVGMEIIQDLATDLASLSWVISLIIIASGTIFMVMMLSHTLRPLRNVMRMQQQFLANAAHELRTPLSIMKTNSEVALMDVSNMQSEEIRSTLVGTVEEIDRMSGVIDNLLNLARMNDEMTELPFSIVYLDQVITQTLASILPFAEKKHITLEVIRLDPCIILGNNDALQRMMSSLLQNAVAFTPEHGLVVISLKNNNTMVELIIQDTGVGISENDLQYVFDPFYRNSSGRSSRFEGSSGGLGLSVARQIVTRHHGTISLKSTEGKGTSVRVEFAMVPTE